MKNNYKDILLYFSFICLLLAIIFGIDALKNEIISLQNQMLVKQAQTHFQDQVNTRKWSAQYGGVYAKPVNGLEPNPYLPDNTLQTADGETLVKINPAWMTRQLSELLKNEEFSFRITSLDPINPINKADDFEKRALKYVIENHEKEYFEIDSSTRFRYMGALKTIPSCLPCHASQGYEIGDIRGGISISLDKTDYNQVVESIESRALIAKILMIFLLASIALLIHRQIRNHENLKNEIFRQTKEVKTTKKLLQEILDTDRSFLMVASGERLIFGNKTMLDFFEVDTIEEFFKKYQHLSNFFLDENKEFLSAKMDGEHWITYVGREQKNKDIKVLMNNKENEARCFRPHLKELVMDAQKLNIIIFNDVTDEVHMISSLEEKASKDALTGLFNKGRFNEVILKEMELAESTSTPMSLVFLDIDHFKNVNDTHGHDVGDYILKELAKILSSTVRKGDFLARWGGEEFVVTLQATKAEEALVLAEKIRKNVEDYSFTSGGKQTVSLGVTEYIHDESEEAFLKRVDEALYEAKETGRNKTVVR